jgi:four helix bundle protein
MLLYTPLLKGVKGMHPSSIWRLLQPLIVCNSDFGLISMARGLLPGRGMNPQQLRDRSKAFAIAIVRLCRALPNEWAPRTLGGQLLRSGTSVAANYRAACRGRSGKEFCAKLGLVAEESDESLLWLELLVVGSPGIKGKNYDLLVREADELTAIFTASYRTAKENLKKEKRERRSRERKSPNHQIP